MNALIARLRRALELNHNQPTPGPALWTGGSRAHSYHYYYLKAATERGGR